MNLLQTIEAETLAARDRETVDVRPGDTVRAEVEVIDIEYAKRRVKLDCRCMVGHRKVLVGEATVLAPSAKFD